MRLRIRLAIACLAIACLLTLEGLTLAQQEYSASTCAQANCADCMQCIAYNYTSVCPANVPNLCYSSSNPGSGAALGAWCIQSASKTPPTCSQSSSGSQGQVCGTMKYWNCGCITNGGVCNFCPCNAANPTGTWKPDIMKTTCTNVASP